MSKISKKIKKTETSSFGVSGRFSHNSDEFYNSKLYHEIKSEKSERLKENEFPNEFKNKIICSSSEKMSELPDNSVHLVITSPPYNVSKEYDEDLSLNEYFNISIRNLPIAKRRSTIFLPVVWN